MVSDKTPEELYQEREKRIRDAVNLREPDRVPVVVGGSYFGAKYAGLDFSSVYYDVAKWIEACKKTIGDFAPDAYGSLIGSSGNTLGILGTLQTRWPGGTLPPNVGHQFVEAEYMLADEYDLFLSDPSDFVLRYYLPRVYEEMKPLAEMSSPKSWLAGFIQSTPFFASPQMQQVFDVLVKAGQEQQNWMAVARTLSSELAAMGFPPSAHPTMVGGAPYDSISNRLRGMRGVMLDMYKRPEKLLAAMDMVLGWQLDKMIPADPAAPGDPKIAFSALHRGSAGFMSIKQFEKFYWPGLKTVILKTIEMGYIANPFFEGSWNDRLEYLLEIPKGKMICRFAETDMARAKEVLGDHFCIMGNVPITMLQIGSAQEVEDYCKNLIKVVGKGGGFIMRASTDAMDQAKPENVMTMVETAKKYGWY